MEAIDGYKRAALSLWELPLDEQSWILDQLDEHDRMRINAVLLEMNDPERARAPATAAPKANAAPAPVAETDGYATAIGESHSQVLASVLGEQPVWVAAIVAASLPKSRSVQQYVRHLPPEQSERVRRAATQTSDAIKPKVRDIVLRTVAERLKQRTAALAPADEFESVLTRVTG